jgi:single-stranded DNA-binding protein
MAVETITTGNLVADAEVRFTPNGKQVTELRIGATYSRKDKQTGQWQDEGEPVFITAAFWGDGHEHLHNLKKGTRVTVSGPLKVRTYQTQNGEDRTSLELIFPRFLGAIPKGDQQTTYQAPAGGQAQDPWANQNAPF